VLPGTDLNNGTYLAAVAVLKNVGKSARRVAKIQELVSDFLAKNNSEIEDLGKATEPYVPAAGN